jgi:hypothetical protein
MTRAKLAPEVPKPGPTTVTAQEVGEWFLAAGVTNRAAATKFAACVESYRALNERPAGSKGASKFKARDALIREFHADARKLAGTMSKLWRRLESEPPEFLDLLLALRKASQALPPTASKAHRPVLPSTIQAVILRDRLAALLPADATMTAMRSILRAALKRCGWEKDRKSSDVGKLLKRTRLDRGTLIAGALVTLPVAPRKRASRRPGRE